MKVRKLFWVAPERKFINGEKFKVLRTLSGDKERSEWSRIMHKYLKKCGLGEFFKIHQKKLREGRSDHFSK